MNKEISYRQFAFMYLFICLSPIIRQIPTALAKEAGRSAYLSPLWSILVIIPLTAIVILFLSVFPGFHIGDMIEMLAGKFLTKIIILGYLLWFLLTIISKATIFTLTLQFTLMPQTQSDFILVTLIILVSYSLLRGIKTLFRFSEFTLGTLLFIFILLFFCAFSRVRKDYLLPLSIVHLLDTVAATRYVAAIGGNIIMALFFADKIGITGSKLNKRKLWYSVFGFLILSFTVTLFTIGVTGAGLASNLPFPFYITVKSISFFNIFERFEVLFTLICILSDFVSIGILAILLMRSFCWLLHLEYKNYFYIPITVIIYYLTYYLSKTQFEYDFLYRYIILYVDLVFQYLIPLLLSFIYLIRRKQIAVRLKNQRHIRPIPHA